MPLMTFESEKLTNKIKEKLIQKLTKISAKITGFPEGSFYMSIKEQPDENIALGGITVRELKKQAGK